MGETIIAFGDRILVRILEIEHKNGILIVPKDKKEWQIGQVVSLGFDLPLFEANEGGFLQIDDYVWSRKYAGLLIEYAGIEYVALEYKEILAFSKELK